MIGPGGLLLVVPHLFAVIWVGLKKQKKKLNMDVKNIFAGHILRTAGDAVNVLEKGDTTVNPWP
jgi:hypothetical protein